jgi:hypothetical protein
VRKLAGRLIDSHTCSRKREGRRVQNRTEGKKDGKI